MAFPARIALFFLLLAAGPAVAADDLLRQSQGRYAIDHAASRIEFSVPKVGGGAIAGRFRDFSGRFAIHGDQLQNSSVEITIVPASVATGEDRVDAFLKGKAVLDAERNPQVRFRSTRVTRTGPRTARIDGLLRARGVEMPARFDAELIKRSGSRLVFRVTGDIRRSLYDMQIGVPIYSNVVRFDMILNGRRG